jgi:hypothetical protein
MTVGGRAAEGVFASATKWFGRGAVEVTTVEARAPVRIVLRPETENSISNLAEDSIYRNPETLRNVRRGQAFSGVYRPETGRFLAFRSVASPAVPGSPVNAVHSRGGHVDIDMRMTELLGEDSYTSIGFTMFSEGEDGFSVGWRSRSINQTNYRHIDAPPRYREAVMQAISEATGRRVWSL